MEGLQIKICTWDLQHKNRESHLLDLDVWYFVTHTTFSFSTWPQNG